MTARLPHASNRPGAYKLEVDTFYGEILDRFVLSQNSFFAACEAYVRDPSGRYDQLADTTADLDVDLGLAIHRIAAQRINSTTGILHAHDFMIVTDALRAEFLARLNPEGNFVAHRDCVNVEDFRTSLPTKLEEFTPEDIIDGLAAHGSALLSYDATTFAESVVTGYPYGVAA